MKRGPNPIAVMAFAIALIMFSCGQEGKNAVVGKQADNSDAALQKGGVVLLIADADLIEIEGKPQYNTAEWLFWVDTPGRYDVWLSSLTVDTSMLRFADNVVITAGETTLTKKPVGDQIVTEDTSVKEPWYRADSHMGSVFFSQPGEYPVQVISEGVESHSSDVSQINPEKHTLINSVILKPKSN